MTTSNVSFDNDGISPAQISVTIVQNSGGGVRITTEIPAGTTLGTFLADKVPDARPTDRVGVISRTGSRVPCNAEYTLADGDTVSFTPTSMKAA
jgi:hypothetical protein